MGILVAAVIVAAILGVGASVRIGGADMPVLISTLNATAGFAAAFCGIILESYLLVAAGATVAASGSVLTQVMCKAMNRNIFQVLTGIGSPSSTPRKTATVKALDQPAAPAAPEPAAAPTDPLSRAAQALRGAKRAIIVPGYGMAVAQAQFELVNLARKLP